MSGPIFASILALLACHCWEETSVGGHNRHARASRALAMLAYGIYAFRVAWAG
jgi:hypothetical protein